MRSIIQSSTSLLIIAIAALVASCADPASPPGPPPIVLPKPDEPVVYSKHIEPIFINTCGGSGCHMDGENLGGVALDTWEKTMEGAPDYGAEVIPYSARKSHLFQHINIDPDLAPIAEPRMPLSRDPLTREQVLAVMRWIDEGAKNDKGEVALGDPARGRVFIAARNEGLVTVIDQPTGRVARYIDVGGSEDRSRPYGVTLSPDGSALYVAFADGGMLAKYDAHTFAPLGSVRVGGTPGQMVLTRDGSTLYVANGDHLFEHQSIARVDTRAMRLVDTIGPVGLGAQGVVLSGDERTLYTINTEGDDISIVDLATGQVRRRIPVSYGNPIPTGFIAAREPFHGVLDPDGRHLWVTCRKSGEVRVIDLESAQVVDSMFVGARPLMAALTPNGRELWVPNEATNSVAVVDVATHRIITRLTDLNGGPQGVGFSADGATAYVSCLSSAAHHSAEIESGGLYMIRVRDHYPLQLVEIGAGAAGVGVGR